MVAVAQTAGLPWHVTFPKAKLRAYLATIDEPEEEEADDPPPGIEDLWENVDGAHATVEWYRGAWDNPANPRIFSNSGSWSFLAAIGTAVGKGRETVDPFTGVSRATWVTAEMKEKYNRFTKGNPAGAVIGQILAKNLA